MRDDVWLFLANLSFCVLLFLHPSNRSEPQCPATASCVLHAIRCRPLPIGPMQIAPDRCRGQHIDAFLLAAKAFLRHFSPISETLSAPKALRPERPSQLRPPCLTPGCRLASHTTCTLDRSYPPHRKYAASKRWKILVGLHWRWIRCSTARLGGFRTHLSSFRQYYPNRSLTAYLVRYSAILGLSVVSLKFLDQNP